MDSLKGGAALDAAQHHPVHVAHGPQASTQQKNPSPHINCSPPDYWNNCTHSADDADESATPDNNQHTMILKKAVRDILDHHPIVVDAQRVWSAPASYPNNRDRATAMLSAWTQNLEHQLKFLTSKFVPGPSLVVDGGKPVSFYPVPGTFHLFAPTNTVPLSRRIKYGLQKADWVPTPQAPASFAPKPGLPPSVPSAGSNNVAFANAVNEEQSEAVKVTGKQVKVTGEQFIPTLASDGSLIPVYDWDAICAAGIDLLSLTEKPLFSYEYVPVWSATKRKYKFYAQKTASPPHPLSPSGFGPLGRFDPLQLLETDISQELYSMSCTGYCWLPDGIALILSGRHDLYRHLPQGPNAKRFNATSPCAHYLHPVYDGPIPNELKGVAYFELQLWNRGGSASCDSGLTASASVVDGDDNTGSAGQEASGSRSAPEKASQSQQSADDQSWGDDSKESNDTNGNRGNSGGQGSGGSPSEDEFDSDDSFDSLSSSSDSNSDVEEEQPLPPRRLPPASEIRRAIHRRLPPAFTGPFYPRRDIPPRRRSPLGGPPITPQDLADASDTDAPEEGTPNLRRSVSWPHLGGTPSSTGHASSNNLAPLRRKKNRMGKQFARLWNDRQLLPPAIITNSGTVPPASGGGSTSRPADASIANLEQSESLTVATTSDVNSPSNRGLLRHAPMSFTTELARQLEQAVDLYASLIGPSNGVRPPARKVPAATSSHQSAGAIELPSANVVIAAGPPAAGPSTTGPSIATQAVDATDDSVDDAIPVNPHGLTYPPTNPTPYNSPNLNPTTAHSAASDSSGAGSFILVEEDHDPQCEVAVHRLLGLSGGECSCWSLVDRRPSDPSDYDGDTE